ncbi:MAG: hypothetical protein NTX91_03120 [candidate division SR1 bacterium]|nr:hypothetical protein [candidate division SR1 bacterium]
MFRAVFGNILQSFGTVLWKKTLLISSLPELLFRFLGELNGLIICVVVIALSGFDRALFLNMRVVGGIIFVLIIDIRYDYLDQSLYREEKVSTMIPYENLNCVFAIVAGYLMFRDASLISVGISMIVIIMTILSSMDFKHFTWPKNIKKILLIQILITAETLITGYFLKDVSDKDFFIVYQVVIIIMLLFPFVIKNFFSQIKSLKPRFRGYQTISSTSNNISFLLYLFLVSEFGVVISTLLSFLGDGITLLFGFIFLREKPSKKDVIMIVATTVLVGLGFYFK